MNLFQMVRRSDKVDEIVSAIDSADIDMIGENGQNLLHTAIAHDKTEIGVELVNRQIAVNWQDDRGMTPLHYTAWHNTPKLAELVLQNGGDPHIRDSHGNTPLWYAVFFARGDYALVELLLNAGADAKSENAGGKSPLEFAEQIGDGALAELLMREA